MKRRDRGSALVIATIMLFVTVAMIGLLLGAPQAQLTRVQAAVTKERSVGAAQSGVSDALAWLQANASPAQSWMQPAQVAWVSGTLGTPATQTIPTTPASPGAQTAATS